MIAQSKNRDPLRDYHAWRNNSKVVARFSFYNTSDRSTVREKKGHYYEM
jgi:hypothetical protein